MTRIIAIAIDKGGSGKTTTAVEVATGLTLHRKRKVLLVGLDPQADAEKHCGLKPRLLTKTINTLFTEVGTNVRDLIITTPFGLDVLPANKSLDDTDRSMRATQVGLLKPILEQLNDYDYIIIDTRRAGSYLTINALVAATDVLIPLQAEYLAFEGLVDTMQDIRNVKRGLNPLLNIIGILPTMVRARTNLAKAILEELGEDYADMVLPVQIHDSVRFAEASYAGKPTQIYAPDAAREYLKLVEMIDA